MKIDVREEREEKERNRRQRLQFIDGYVEWLRRAPTRPWSRQHGNVANAGVPPVPRKRGASTKRRPARRKR